LRLKRGKCSIWKSSVDYLGHYVDAKGIHTAPGKVAAIFQAPAPPNVTELRSFLGMVNYYGKFILTWPCCCIPSIVSLGVDPSSARLRSSSRSSVSCQHCVGPLQTATPSFSVPPMHMLMWTDCRGCRCHRILRKSRNDRPLKACLQCLKCKHCPCQWLSSEEPRGM